MFFIPRTDTVNDSLRLQNVLLTKRFLRLLAAAVGAQHFAGDALSVFLGHAALNGIHLQKLSALISLVIFGIGRRSQTQNHAHHDLRAHSTHPQKSESHEPRAEAKESLSQQLFLNGSEGEDRSRE